MKKRVVVLISGRGSNMISLIEAARDPAYPCEIVGVISNKAGAPGLDYAAAHGIRTIVISHKSYSSREEFDQALNDYIVNLGAELIACAGFMRVLTPTIINHWLGRMVNIHPSLLPDYPGLDTHARALSDGAVEAGCTVHFVTPEVDGGPIIAQAKVKVLEGDTPETLAARVLKQEHQLYPFALAAVAEGAIQFKMPVDAPWMLST